MWPWHAKVEADERELAQAGLSRLNDWGSPAGMVKEH